MMRYIKLFESFGDTALDILYAELASVDVYFEYGRVLKPIDEFDDIQGFIREYIDTARETNQWIGGPLNSKWANKWYEFFGLKTAYRDWKPEIKLKLTFVDGSYVTLGFSIISKECGSFDYSGRGSRVVPTTSYDFFITVKNDWGKYNYDEYHKMISDLSMGDYIPELEFNWEGGETN